MTKMKRKLSLKPLESGNIKITQGNKKEEWCHSSVGRATD